MRYLLDTQTALWAIYNSDRLPQNIKDIIADESNLIFISAISFWEIAIKHAKKPNLMPYSAKDLANAYYDTDYIIEDVRFQDLIALEEDVLSIALHADPFDLGLIATAISDSLILITCDSVIKKYKLDNILAY